MNKFWRISWFFTAVVIIAFFLLPIAAILYQSTFSQGESVSHLWNTVLFDYLKNSLLLVGGTVILSLIFALPCSWIVSTFQFKGQGVLQWVMCLPLAMPPYLVGYLYTDLLDFAGPVQGALRQLFGWSSGQDYWFPPIRTLGGACLVLALVLYPYIFLLTRIALLEQSENLNHSAKILGVSGWRLIKKVTFPLVRPAMAIGTALVAMETLGDFGTVSYFAVPTLTTAVYDTWFGLGDLGTASQISLLMLFLIFLLLSLERYSRRKQKLYQRGYERRQSLRPLHGWKLWLAQSYCWGLVSFAFFIPLAKLLYWSYHYFEQSWDDRFWHYAYNSLSVSITAALISVLLALLLLFFKRLNQQRLTQRQNRSGQYLARYGLPLSSLGYAVPGTVLAIGLMIPFTTADHWLNDLMRWLDRPLVGLVFSGSMFALVSAYIIRFSAMSIGSVETSLNKIAPSLDMASRTLGYNGLKMLLRVHFPLLSKGLLTALMLVFLESMKELNASLLLRPFNFDTLATHVFTLTSDEQLEQASLSAVFLVLVGLVPVIILTRSLLADKSAR
ncbi:ABC transporter permease [Testudinibacter aquarius]|uniref:Iron ABC transporter permease n=1 Tax=Testudinibacter aquarius TaxID=1524974 RepID=A0A4R3XXC4_9PAST|nr:iron ABC transporter permease [Testudinibacter aquarius]KAE9526427.1 iron ABC transporter permease [Testudinibacter aquarius]TCV83667.1 iron(III) transport system permease protein [Testudinibacter aquarius]TNG93215.1 iron ABC transporter permease [Testudinibacter aquarius]